MSSAFRRPPGHPGRVSNFEINGQRRFAIRIWLDRRSLAARNLTWPTSKGRSGATIWSCRRARSNRPRASSPSASTAGFRMSMPSGARGRHDSGYPIRLADVARVELGAEDDSSFVRSDGRPSSASRAPPVAATPSPSRTRSRPSSTPSRDPAGRDGDPGRLGRRHLHPRHHHRGADRARIAVVLVVLVIFVFHLSPGRRSCRR